MTEAYHEALERVERDHWWFKALRRLVSECLQREVPPPARVLDVGCSTGHLLDGLPATYERRGVEFNVDAVEHARNARPDIQFDVGSIEALPLDTASFDAVLAIDVISAVGVENDLRAVSELRRILKPGGTLIAQVAAYEWLRSGHDIGAGTARRYTARQFERLLRNAGFSSVKVSYRVTALFLPAALWRLLRRRGAKSDVAPVAPVLNYLFTKAMNIEHPLALRGQLPFGLSVFAIAKVDTAPPPSRSGIKRIAVAAGVGFLAFAPPGTLIVLAGLGIGLFGTNAVLASLAILAAAAIIWFTWKCVRKKSE